MVKQRMSQREQDHLDQVMILKKSLEKKVEISVQIMLLHANGTKLYKTCLFCVFVYVIQCSDAWEECEEQRQIVAQLKRRIQKLSSELSDIRCLHQEEASKSSLLEKKQRRFDTELSSLNASLDKERVQKEKALRERDSALIQKDALSNEIIVSVVYFIF